MSDRLIDDEFMNRPDSDDLAFLHYEKMFRVSLDQALMALQEESGEKYWDSHDHFMQTYINRVLATAGELNLEMLEYWTNNPSEANNSSNFKQIKYDIDGAITRIKIRHAQFIRKASVRLELISREKIRDLITKIKLNIEAMELPLPRKEALMSRLNAFSAEVDRDRTRFEAFAALVIEAAGVAGKVEKKLRPIRKWIDSIASMLHEARALEDAHTRLSGPDKRLQAPTKQIAPPSGELWVKPEPPKSGGGADEEVPF